MCRLTCAVSGRRHTWIIDQFVSDPSRLPFEFICSSVNVEIYTIISACWFHCQVFLWIVFCLISAFGCNRWFQIHYDINSSAEGLKRDEFLRSHKVIVTLVPLFRFEVNFIAQLVDYLFWQIPGLAVPETWRQQRGNIPIRDSKPIDQCDLNVIVP